MTDVLLTELERAAGFEEAERTFQMTEEAFRAFYELTARPLWLYLARTTGDRRLADDLLQETYYRFLRAKVAFESDDHRRHYVFRIAANLVRDHWRRPRADAAGSAPMRDEIAAGKDGAADRLTEQIDLARALGRLSSRERSLVWLAYVQGWSHEEIAAAHGLKASSLKVLLHRARRRLAALLGAAGARGGRS
jgi:RNA polymerase sigma-70 factor (ECF subfamily)